MLEIIFWSGVIIVGPLVYGLLGGEYKEISPKPKKNTSDDNYKSTKDYFDKLTLEEQHQYINNNKYLCEYSTELKYDNRESTSREVARRADKLGRTFNDRYDRY